jgi:putative spermidine/putrescine transport system ATP-binding protein
MALADTMVVMNHGVIEQVGSPHDDLQRAGQRIRRPLHGRPQRDRTRRPARSRAQRPYRASHRRTPGQAAGLPQRTGDRDVEYQGAYVLLGLHDAGSRACAAHRRLA